MSDSRPLPVITEDNLPFWKAAAEHRLVLPSCRDCGKVFFPIGPVCPDCHSMSLDWTQVSGRGVISSFVVYRQAFYSFFRDKLPYTVVQVELEEGPRFNGNLLGVEPGDIHIGMPVQAVFERVNDEVTLTQFEPRKVG